MRPFEDFCQELNSAKQRNDFPAIIALCRDGAEAYIIQGTREWYGVRFNLGCALMDTRRGFGARVVEEASSLLSELAAHPPKDESARWRAACLLGLGRAYWCRRKGDALHNLRRSARALVESLRYYTRERKPCTWASVKALLGQVYCRTGRITGKGAFIRRSICCYEQALELFTHGEYPEEKTEVEGMLDMVKHARAAKSE